MLMEKMIGLDVNGDRAVGKSGWRALPCLAKPVEALAMVSGSK
jgi:hypothetical protein